jgi:outer membrane protein TolC
VAQYNQAVLDAAREVADQGAALRALERQRQAVDTSLAALQRAYDSSRLRRSRGLTNQLEVLEAQTALLAQQRVQAQLRASELQTQLALIKALGGGYDAASIATSAAATGG